MQRILGDLELIVKKVTGDTWQLVDDLHYHVGHKDSEEVIIVPKGFVTDFASTPLGVHNLLPKDGSWSPAAVVHDELYRYRGILPLDRFLGSPQIYSQADCDQIFLEAMAVLKVSWWQRTLMWSALRLFGWLSFNKKANQPGRKV